MPCRYRACHAFGRRQALAAVPPLRVVDAAVRLRKIILLYKLFIQYFELYRDAGVQEYRHLHRENGMRECRSTDICIGRTECGSAGVQTFASGVRNSGCRSADICIGSTECGMRECRSADICIGMRDAGVQTFASGCGSAECGIREYRSADISFWLMAVTISPHGFHP